MICHESTTKRKSGNAGNSRGNRGVVPRAAGFSSLLSLVLLAILAGCGVPSRFVGNEIYQGNFGIPPEVASAALPDSIVVASYNIAFALQVDRAARELLSDPALNKVDILLLQEMDPEGTALLARQLGLYYVYGPAYLHPRHDHRWGTAVLSRWPIVGYDSVILPHSDPLTRNHRRAVAADIAVGDHLLRAVSVHLSTMVVSFEDRLHQATVVSDSLGRVDYPLIIGGDFNSVSGFESRKVGQGMRRWGLREVRLPAGKTVRSRSLDLLGQEAVFDHIFYRGLEPLRSGIAHEFTASDHFPIWAVFTWPGAAGDSRPASLPEPGKAAGQPEHP